MEQQLFASFAHVAWVGPDGDFSAMNTPEAAAAMRQAIDAVDPIVHAAQVEVSRAAMERHRAVRLTQLTRAEAARLRMAALTGLVAGRDTSAREAVVQQIALERQLAALSQAEADARLRELELQEGVIEMATLKRQMEASLRCFVDARRGRAPAFGPLRRRGHAADGQQALDAFVRALRAVDLFAMSLRAAGPLEGRAARLRRAAVAPREEEIAERLDALRRRLFMGRRSRAL